MSGFFNEGGFVMLPVLVFGLMAIASAAVFLGRPERRIVGLTIALGLTTLTAGLLGFAFGMINTFRFVDQVPTTDQFNVITAGTSESLHGVALALALLVITGLLASIASLRASRLPASSAVGA